MPVPRSSTRTASAPWSTRTVGVIHSELFRPAFAQILSRLQRGTSASRVLSPPGITSSNLPGEYPMPPPGGLRPKGGGVLPDLGYHLVYLTAAVLGWQLHVTRARFVFPTGARRARRNARTGRCG